MIKWKLKIKHQGNKIVVILVECCNVIGHLKFWFQKLLRYLLLVVTLLVKCYVICLVLLRYRSVVTLLESCYILVVTDCYSFVHDSLCIYGQYYDGSTHLQHHLFNYVFTGNL